MDAFDTTIHSTANAGWRKPVVRPSVVTLDRDGNPELADPRRRGGYYPYMTSGKLAKTSCPGILIDVSA